MKHLIVLVILAAASRTMAAPFALDYHATDPSCIDGSRFSDEVSAKLGYVPWSTTASARIWVRVERDGAQFTGMFRNADGSAKIVDGKTCADVTESLVVTVATAVDTVPKAALASAGPIAQAGAPRPATADGGSMIPVTFRSAEGRRLDIAMQKAAGFGVASDGTTVEAAYFEKLCTSPCTAMVPQGRDYLSFSDPDRQTYGNAGLMFDRATTITLAHKSRHGLRVALVAGGAAAAGLGALWLTQTDCSPSGSCLGPILGGTTLATLGITSMLFSLWMHDTFQVSTSP